MNRRRIAFTSLALTVWCMNEGCATERLQGDGSTISLHAMPPGIQEFLLAHDPADGGESQSTLEQRRDSIADAWCERIRTTPYATLAQVSERVVLHGSSITQRYVARAEILMGPERVYTAAWQCDRNGDFNPERPHMKLIYDGGGAVRERAWHADRNWYHSSWYSRWHPWGSDDFTAVDSAHGCMIGSCTQTWLGESKQRDHYLRRLPESTLLPGLHQFSDAQCSIMRWVLQTQDPKTGELDYRHEMSYYFDAQGVLRGRDDRVRGRNSHGNEYRIIQRQLYEWEFYQSAPEQLVAFRSWLLDGPENPATATSPALPVVGSTAPELTLTLVDGRRISLGELLAGGPLVLDFWATWCQPCRAAMPIVQRVAGDYRDRGVQLVAVNFGEERSSVIQYINDCCPSLAVAVDENMNASKSFEVRAIPHLVIIDQQRRIRAIHSGMTDDLEVQLRQSLSDAFDLDTHRHPTKDGH
jgi:thiol-disulfide isomerase/thioredoxin